LVSSTKPDPLALLIFFPLLFMTLTATFVPEVYYLNRRFASPKACEHSVRLLRQSGWVALFVTICAWLQMNRALNWIIASLLLGIFGLTEILVLIR